MKVAPEKLFEVLKHSFGFTSFRPLQEEIIRDSRNRRLHRHPHHFCLAACNSTAALVFAILSSGCATQVPRGDCESLSHAVFSKLDKSQRFLIDQVNCLQITDVGTDTDCTVAYAVHQSPYNAKGTVGIVDDQHVVRDAIFLDGMIGVEQISTGAKQRKFIVVRIFDAYGPGYLKSRYAIFSVNHGRLVNCLELSGDGHSDHDRYSLEATISGGHDEMSGIDYRTKRAIYRTIEDFVDNKPEKTDLQQVSFRFDPARCKFIETSHQ